MFEAIEMAPPSGFEFEPSGEYGNDNCGEHGNPGSYGDADFQAEIERDHRYERGLLLKEILVLAVLAAFMIIRNWVI